MVNILECSCQKNCGHNISQPELSIQDSFLKEEFVYSIDRPHLSSTYISSTSSLKIMWQCNQEHPSWIASPSIRNQRGRIKSCPYCSGVLPITGKTDLATLKPEIAKQWDYQKNSSKPQEHTITDSFRAHWICEKEHKWYTRIVDRTRFNTGCPYCSNRKTLAGVNDFTIDYPELAEEWDYDKNLFPPEKYASGSKKIFNWRHFHTETQSWHFWQASLLNRTKDKSKCVYCSNQRVLEGFNDFETLAPEIAKQWDKDKNDTLPSSYLYGSHSKAWWLCDRGHSWNTSIKARCSGSGCGKCRLVATSKIEQAFHAAFKKRLDTINESYTDKIIIDGKKYQVDIFGTLNGEKIAVEYDGKYYHSNNKEKDIEKSQILIDGGYKLIRIREDGLFHLKFENRNFYQISYNYSLNEKKINQKTIEILSLFSLPS